MRTNQFSSPLGGTEAKLTAQEGYTGGISTMVILAFVLNYRGFIDLSPN